ncbi:hypothetical protein LTR08_005142 [Meristemomyces frigidus]|nr:hypothetical protein LTR08_005142 [Meristemomyces frigidus]
MTTAHRPTFDPARGKDAARGEAYHQRLLPAHKTLKYRQATQGAPGEQAQRDLRAELVRSERAGAARREGRDVDDEEGGGGGAVRLAIGSGEGGPKRKAGDVAGGDGEGEEEEEDYEAKKRRVLAESRDIDADSDAHSAASSEESDSDEEEDETAEILRELAKIKAERAEAAAKVAAAQAVKDAEQREKDIALGNPLLNEGVGGAGGGGVFGGVQRRWDDDVVFKNQGRGTEERGKEKRFVNDLLRSDFHRRFMDKYVR